MKRYLSIVAAAAALCVPAAALADANAYGKCVSSKAKAASQAHTQAIVSAAKSCKADRAANKAAFATTYGTKANAFGKCVALKTKS